MKPPILRTRVYIDGYNFYYGCLRRTAYKWLDVHKLFSNHIIPSIMYDPENTGSSTRMCLTDHSSINYFTAKILERAAKAKDSVSSQAQYLNALKKECGNNVQLHYGDYSIYKSNQPLVDQNTPTTWPRDCDRVQVWKFEEKKSDVKLALKIYDDAVHSINEGIDQIVLVTNDTDLEPVLELLDVRYPHIVRGLVIPTRRLESSNVSERKPNADLTNRAHWVRTHITDCELKASQLPEVVSGNRRPSIKPISWYAKPENVERMLAEAKEVLGSNTKVMKWARTNNDLFGGARPLDMLDDDDTAKIVFDYIENYKKNVA